MVPPVRIAWLGPTPTDGGGATFVGTQLILELGRAGAEVDCFIAGEPRDVAPALHGAENVTLFFRPKNWAWDRWYSRQALVAFLSGHVARARSQTQVIRDLLASHAERPYDVVYQFSQSEYTPLRRHRRRLPPIVIHPSTHAAGELRWVRRESHLARRGEPLGRLAAVEAILAARALVQRYELPRADRVLGVSRVFAEHLAEDYKIPRERLGVVVNPIDLDRFRPGDRVPGSDPVITLLFVSRISVRKGVELIIGLSHRLADLAGQVRIRVVGGPTLWSNYIRLLRDLDARVATFDGQLDSNQLAALYRSSDALLQPSKYEPFGLTVAEALAGGLPVVASDEVGAVDGVDRDVCRTFRSGDLDAFERAVRALIDDLRAGRGEAFRDRARAEAERLWTPPAIARSLIDELRVAVDGPAVRP